MCSKLYGIFKIFWSHRFKEFRYKFERNLNVHFYWKKTKTGVYQEGYWKHSSKLQSALCPIKLFKKNTEAAKVKESEEKFIFRQIWHSKQGFKLKDLDKPISCTTVRDILLTNLKNIGQEGQRQQQILGEMAGYFKNTKDGDQKMLKTDMFTKT